MLEAIENYAETVAEADFSVIELIISIFTSLFAMIESLGFTTEA